jgi:hypothetical protein
MEVRKLTALANIATAASILGYTLTEGISPPSCAEKRKLDRVALSSDVRMLDLAISTIDGTMTSKRDELNRRKGRGVARVCGRLQRKYDRIISPSV